MPKLVYDFILLRLLFLKKRTRILNLHTALLPNLLNPNFNFIACVETGI